MPSICPDPELTDAADMNSVLGKVRLILDAFTAESDELTLSEVVRLSGVPKATCHRLAQELIAWGLLERTGTRYRLGLRLFEMGQLVPHQRILREAALPYMEDLLRSEERRVGKECRS